MESERLISASSARSSSLHELPNAPFERLVQATPGILRAASMGKGLFGRLALLRRNGEIITEAACCPVSRHERWGMPVFFFSSAGGSDLFSQ